MILAQGPLLAAVSRRLGPRTVFAIGMGFLALALVGYQLPGGPLTYAGAACFAIGNGLAWPTFQARIAEVGGDEQGVVQGAVTSTSSLASIVGLIAGGFLYQALGGHLFLAGAGLFGLVLLLTPLWFARPGRSA